MYLCQSFWSRGIALIELMVVLLIMALLAGGATLAFKVDPEHKLELEARRLMEVIRLAREHSIMQGMNIGLILESDAYSFTYYQEGIWQPMHMDRIMGHHHLAEGLAISLRVYEGTNKLSKDDLHTLDGRRYIPQILILSNGEVTPFSIYIGQIDNPGRFYVLQAKFNGQLNLSSSNN